MEGKLLFASLLAGFGAFAQIQFTEKKTILDETHFAFDVSTVVSSDIDNDGQNDLVVASIADNEIVWYKNFLGDFTAAPRNLIATNRQYIRTIAVFDIDSDGWKDVVLCRYINDQVEWFRNLQGQGFADASPISGNNLPGPYAAEGADMDGDGDPDIVVSCSNPAAIYVVENTGAATFGEPQQLFSGSVFGARKIKVLDLDNNGLKDIVFATADEQLYRIQQTEGGIFSEAETIGFAPENGDCFDFIDLDNDGYQDIVAAIDSEYMHLRVFMNLEAQGNGFSQPVELSSGSQETPFSLSVKDMDNDALPDIVVSYGYPSSIGYYPNAGDGSFGAYLVVSQDVAFPKSFAIDDFDGNGRMDIAASSYQGNAIQNTKLSCFFQQDDSSYKQQFISFYCSAIFRTKIADLDGDGLNDVVLASKNFVWQKNTGNGFSSPKLINKPLADSDDFWYDLRIQDLNEDGTADIVAVTSNGLKLYANDGEGNFSEVTVASYTTARDLDIGDLDADGLADIVVSFPTGTPKLVWIRNLGSGTFATPVALNFSNYQFRPKQVRCADIDLDGDLDIVTASDEYHQIQWLKNNGDATFLYMVAGDASAAVMLAEDIDNDGDVDIVCGDNDSYSNYSLLFMRNSGNGSFSAPELIENQTVKSLCLADLDGDGIKDLIGSSYEYFGGYDEKVFVYKGQGDGFAARQNIDSLGEAISLNRDAVAGDLNNDGKPDLVTSYYFIGKVDYLLNESQLSVPDNGSNPEAAFWPNPTRDKIRFNESMLNAGEGKISVYDAHGRQMLSKSCYTNELDLSRLQSGLYMVRIESGGKTFSGKVFKK